MDQSENKSRFLGLAQLRTEIRSLDDQILGLMTKRLELAKEVGKYKLKNDIPIKNFKVEKDVIARAKSRARDLGLYETMAEEVAKLQIRYSVLTQEEHHTRGISDNTDARNITIVGGCGSMGLWLTRFFDSFGHNICVFDFDYDERLPGSVQFTDKLDRAVKDAEFIFVSVPMSSTNDVIRQLIALRPRGIIADICSLKTPVREAIALAEQANLRVSSIHPMFGPSTELLSGQNIVFCEGVDSSTTEDVMALFKDTTANLVRIPLEQHDELMGYVLGMSHMLNLAFAKAVTDSQFSGAQLEAVASSTFRSQMSVAMPIINENQDLYFEIQTGNRHTESLVKEMISAFNAYLTAIASQDRGRFKEYMEASKEFFKSKKP